MDFSGLAVFGQNFALAIVAFIFVLTVIVYIHEMGHFLVARWCGVGVSTFSIGFGPELWARIDRHGTRWRIAAIPLGGYVKFIDDQNAASIPTKPNEEALAAVDPALTFHGKPLWKRAAIVAAGPAANFLLAIVIFTAMFSTIGESVTPSVIERVVPATAADKAGLLAGDRITVVDGFDVETFDDLSRIVRTSANKPINVVFIRDGKQLSIMVTPDKKTVTDRFGNVMQLGQLGVLSTNDPAKFKIRTFTPPQAVWQAVKESYFIVDRTLAFLYDVIIGRQSSDQLGGTIKIAQISGQIASAGIVPLINFIALLSINIGLINLFPVPILDGGHLVFFGIEALRGQPLSDRIQDIGFRIGLALIVMLMVYVNWQDLVGIFRHSTGG